MRRSRGSNEREGHHTSAEDLRDYVMQVMMPQRKISRRCCRISARCATRNRLYQWFSLTPRPRAWDCRPENTRLFEMVKRKESEYERTALVCLAPGSEETEAVTTIDCWFAAVSKSPLPASPAMVTCDYLLARREAAGGCAAGRSSYGEYDVIVLPGGIKGAECFRIAPCWLKPLNSSTVPGVSSRYLRRTSHRAGPARYLPDWQLTGFPTLKDKIPAEQWQDKRSSGMHG